MLLHPSSSKKVPSEKATKTETITSSSLKNIKATKEDSSDKVKDDDPDDSSSVADTNYSEATSASATVKQVVIKQPNLHKSNNPSNGGK